MNKILEFLANAHAPEEIVAAARPTAVHPTAALLAMIEQG